MKPLNISVGRDKDGTSPVCPYCEQNLSAIRDYRSHLKFLSNMHVFTCPHCYKVLSIAVVPK
jgi:predicted amidophosphoribosyltransferase